jgi:hypothetical protein
MTVHIHLVSRLRIKGKGWRDRGTSQAKEENNIFVYFIVHVLYIVKWKTEDTQQNNKNFQQNAFNTYHTDITT